MSKKKGKKKIKKLNGICVFCGKAGVLTGDHIPPRNLFVGVPSDELITVPSCEECNNSSKLDDEYFRAFLIPQADVAAHPQAEKLNQRVRRNFDQNPRKGFETRMLSQMHQHEVFTPAGIYLGTASFIYPEYSRIDGSLKKIIRGLFFHLMGARLPVELFNISVIDQSQSAELQQFLPKMDIDHWLTDLGRWPLYNVRDIFSYRCAVAQERPPIIVAFLLTFFEARNFFGIVYPNTLGPETVLQDPDPNIPAVIAV